MIGLELIAFAVALGAGVFGALVGVGGGLIIVPLLVAFGVEVHSAIGVSLLGVISVSTAGSVSYLKAGFKLEGRQREAMRRDDRRWDMVFMGILRDEWLASGGS